MRTRHYPPRKRNKAKSKMEHSCEQKPEETIVKIPTGKVNVVEDFITDFWEVLTPEMVSRLEFVLINDIGLSKQKAAEFITSLKEIRKENFYEKMVQENRTVRVGPRNQWIKEVSNTIGCHLAEVVVDFLLSNRTNRSKRLTENILNHLCLLTGETATVETAQTRIERTMVVVADRMAKWIDEALTDIECRKGFRNDIDVGSSSSSESLMVSIKSSQSDYTLTEYEASPYPVYPFIPVIFGSTVFDQEHLHPAPQVGGDEGQSIQQSVSSEKETTSDEESSEIEEDIEIIEEDEEEESGGDRNIVQDKGKTKREHKDKKPTKIKPKTEKKLSEGKDTENTPINHGKEKKIKTEGGKSKEKSSNDDLVVKNKDKKDKERKSKKNKGDKNKKKKDKSKNNVNTDQKSNDTVSEMGDSNKVNEGNLTDEEDGEDVESDVEIEEEESEMSNVASDKVESEEEVAEEQNQESEELEVEEESDVEEEERSEVKDEKSEVEDKKSEVGKDESEVGKDESEVGEEESEVGEEESEVGKEESEIGEESEVKEEKSAVGEEIRKEDEDDEEEEVEEEDEKLEDKSKQGDYTPSKSTSTTSLISDVPPKASIERQIPDVLDLVKDDMKFLGKGDTKSERPRAIKKILEERFKNIFKEEGKKSLDTLMGRNIDEAASIAANWIENILLSADSDITLKPSSISKPFSMSKPSSIVKPSFISKPSPMSKISSISSVFQQGSAFKIKMANNGLFKASKLSYRNVAQKVADVRGIELPETISPMNASSAKEWAEWALSATNMGDKWGKWLDTKISEMEKRLLNGGPRASLDRYKSWTDWRNTAGQEAETWRAENIRLKDEGNVWKEKLQKKPVKKN